MQLTTRQFTNCSLVCLTIVLLMPDSSDACRRRARRTRCTVISSGAKDTGATQKSSGSANSAPNQNGSDADKDYWKLPDSSDTPNGDSPSDQSIETKEPADVNLDAQASRLWTDNTGDYHVQARVFEILDGQVRLLKQNGKYCTVPLDRLSAGDREYVESLAVQHGRGVIAHIAGR